VITIASIDAESMPALQADQARGAAVDQAAPVAVADEYAGLQASAAAEGVTAADKLD
jgi:hypothetical protein